MVERTAIEVIQWTLAQCQHSHGGGEMEHPFAEEAARSIAQAIRVNLLVAGYEITPMDPRVRTFTKPFRTLHNNRETTSQP